MGDPRGFLLHQRELPPRRPVPVRLRDWKEVYEEGYPAARLQIQVNDGVVTVYQGVNQTLGPISLSRPLYTTTIAVDDLPPSYQSSLEQGIDVDDRAAADARVEDLRLQATACRWARLNGEECRTVPSTWTPPSPTPTLTPTPSPSGTPSGTTPAPTPTTTSRGPSPTGSPVTA